jgi:hypothetical protein
MAIGDRTSLYSPWAPRPLLMFITVFVHRLQEKISSDHKLLLWRGAPFTSNGRGLGIRQHNIPPQSSEEVAFRIELHVAGSIGIQIIAKQEKQCLVIRSIGREFNIASDLSVFRLHQTIIHNNRTDSEKKRLLWVGKSGRSPLIRLVGGRLC